MGHYASDFTDIQDEAKHRYVNRCRREIRERLPYLTKQQIDMIHEIVHHAEEYEHFFAVMRGGLLGKTHGRNFGSKDYTG